jgi:hypothetical protein
MTNSDNEDEEFDVLYVRIQALLASCDRSERQMDGMTEDSFPIGSE